MIESFRLMKFLLSILFLFISLTGLYAQTAGWNADGFEGLSPAIQEGNNSFEVRIFPNPVVDKRLNIELTDQIIQELRITNIAGVIIFSKKFSAPVNRYQVLLDNVSNGVYLLRITSSGNQTRTLKLMVRNQ
jgi:hypothetical protein